MTSTSSDPELLRLLLLELERHLVTLEAEPRDVVAVQRAVHALKGSAGLAGERELAATLERLHRRVKEGDETAFPEAASLVRTAVQRLGAGESAIAARWPIPPDDLGARPLDPLVRAQYAAEVTDRLARIDEALSTGGDPLEAVRNVYRHIHTMKGAASAVGDEPMSWFCHGLEERVKGGGRDGHRAGRATGSCAMARRPRSAPRRPRHCAGDAARARTALAGAADVRAQPPVDRGRSTRSPRGRPRSTRRRPRSASRRSTSSACSRSSTRSTSCASASRRARSARTRRPWRCAICGPLWSRRSGSSARRGHGARPRRPSVASTRSPHRSARSARTSTRHRCACRRPSTGCATTWPTRRNSSRRCGRRPSGRIFARLTTAIESEARRSGRAVIVRTRGADETIDRRIAEQLVEPCLQLVRNAVAHGIEPPETRVGDGKAAEREPSRSRRASSGNRLADDDRGRRRGGRRGRRAHAGARGRPGDAGDRRGRRRRHAALAALRAGLLDARVERSARRARHRPRDRAERRSSAWAAGIRLSSRAGRRVQRAHRRADRERAGDRAVGDGGARGARDPGGQRAARPPGGRRRRRPLARSASALVPRRGRPARCGPYVVDLELQDDDAPAPPVAVGVDAVGRTEELLVRPLGPLVAGLGPYAGAIVRGDGSLRLAIDAWAVAPRARAFSAARPGGERTPAAEQALGRALWHPVRASMPAPIAIDRMTEADIATVAAIDGATR